MATRGLVPRANGEGSIGTTLKRWATGFINAITCTTINAITIAAQTVGFTISGGTSSKTLTVTDNTTLAGPASSTVAGPVELATDAEAIASASAAVVLTPSNLAAKYGVYAIHEVSEFPDDFTAAGLALLDDADAAAQRATLGLGTIATQAANNVNISGGAISGITDLAVADGGTGASDAATARSNLGLAIGTNVMAYEAYSIHEFSELCSVD